jgi:membrane protease YdiL (CAAX protease family)
MAMTDNLNPVSDPNTGLKPAAQASAAERGLAQKVFLGPNGLRAGWRLAIYILIVVALSYASHELRVHFFPSSERKLGEGLRPVRMLLGEIIGFVVASIAALVMARIEREKWDHYGLPVRRAFRADFWIGCVWGFGSLSIIMGILHLGGAYHIEGFALAGAAVWKFALLWGVMFLFVGLLEEFVTRGYVLYTLASGIGFWPAAIITSALFFAGHVRNPGETWYGLADVFIIGVFFCFTVWRTGDLWFAVGLHAAWDWGLTFFYSVPNSGMTASGHLFNIQTQGPTWLSGGSAGPEGSFVNLISDLLFFVIFAFLYRKRKWVGMDDRRIAVQKPTSEAVVIDSSALG